MTTNDDRRSGALSRLAKGQHGALRALGVWQGLGFRKGRLGPGDCRFSLLWDGSCDYRFVVSELQEYQLLLCLRRLVSKKHLP